MNRMTRVVALALAALVLAPAAFAAADAKTLLGTWNVSRGVYADGSVEKELAMSFTFTATTLTNPMDGGQLSYTLDEKSKTISAKGNGSSITIVYRVIDAKTLEFTSMVVTTDKAMEIIGPKGMFTSMSLAKAK